MDGPVYNPYHVPLQIKRVYDFTNLQKSELYYGHNVKDCSIGAYEGDSIIKESGNTYYRIKHRARRDDEAILTDNDCDKVYFTIDQDYFWAIKNVDSLIKTIKTEPKTK